MRGRCWIKSIKHRSKYYKGTKAKTRQKTQENKRDTWGKVVETVREHEETKLQE